VEDTHISFLRGVDFGMYTNSSGFAGGASLFFDGSSGSPIKLLEVGESVRIIWVTLVVGDGSTMGVGFVFLFLVLLRVREAGGDKGISSKT